MIIFRYLIKEVAKTQVAVFLVLMTIFISNEFVRILAKASAGTIPGDTVLTFIGLFIPGLAMLVLPLSLFLGILISHGRIYAENEMAVFHACGISEWYVVRVTMVVSVVFALTTALMSFYLSPLTLEMKYQEKEKIAADSGLDALMEGRFQKTGNSSSVVFIHDKNNENNTLEKVFVAQVPETKNHEAIINSSIVYAEKGQVVENVNGSQQLILSNGNRYQRNSETGEYRNVSFGQYHIQIEDQKVEHRRRKLGAIPTIDLLNDNRAEYHAELHWRLAFPVMCLIVTLIAVPLSAVNPRQGKFAKLAPAFFLFLGYYLLLTTTRSGIESGKIPSSVGLWPVHLCVLLLGASFILRSRVIGKTLRAKLPSISKRKFAEISGIK